MIKVAFQGNKGAYSEMALRQHFDQEAISIGLDFSEGVCDAVETGSVAVGILPVENSIVGNVTVNLDLLAHHNFSIIAEVYQPINHCLLAKKGTSLEEVKMAYSHPVALGQCRKFLLENNIQGHAEFDTAGACQVVLKRNIQGEAVVASALCAEYYDLEVLSDKIQDHENNLTRFVVFMKNDRAPKDLNREKTSIAFRTTHDPGALLECLKIFSMANINLTKLESRPDPQSPFQYTFFVDFQGSINEPHVEKCLMFLNQQTEFYKLLGSYPAASKTFH